MMRSRSAWVETAAAAAAAAAGVGEEEEGGRSLVRRMRRAELDGGGEGSAMVREGQGW